LLFIAILCRMRTGTEGCEHSPYLLRVPLLGLVNESMLQGEVEEIMVGKIECKQYTSPRRTFTKSGLKIMAFKPWELRRDSVDGSTLTLTKHQAGLLLQALPDHLTVSMPPIQVQPHSFLASECVQLCDGVGVITDRFMVLDADTRALIVYAEESKQFHAIPEKRLMKDHPSEQVFHTELLQNVNLIACDYFRAEAKVRLRGTISATGNPVVCGFINSLSYN
jgi:hypothetical protein